MATNHNFIPTTQVWDVSQIYSTEVTSPEFKELLVRMYQQLNTIALAVNGRDAGTYDVQEFINGQKFFPNPLLANQNIRTNTVRDVFRKIINFGALPNNATKTVAHDLTPQTSWTFTRIYGAASDTAGKVYIPLPYSVATLNENIELWVDATNVSIKTAVDFSAYTITYIVLEYLKN